MQVVVPVSPAPSLPPPPPPPKDSLLVLTTKPLPVPDHDHTLASIAHTSPSTPPPTPPPPQAPPRVTLQGRVDLRLSPEERLKRRLSSQRRREREEQDALREEQERQARQKREKEASEQMAREDEARRKAVLQDQLRQAAARRAKEEHDTQVTEERRLRDIRERKQIAHERRVQYTRELQKWRLEQIRRAESQSSEKEEERKRLQGERRSRIASLSDVLFQDESADAFNGWVTIQMPDHLAWKRRYFTFDPAHSQLSLSKSQRDSIRSADSISLEGRIQSFHEWYEGFEELEAIPHSFAVKFVDGHTWLIYADTEQDKDRLLVLLGEAAGVII